MLKIFMKYSLFFVWKQYWKKIFGGIFFLSLLFFLISFFSDSSSDSAVLAENAKTVTVQKGDILKYIKASGQAELVNEQRLRFTKTGTVSRVFVTDGQMVKQGDILVELDMKDLSNDIQQSEISVQNAKITLQDLLKGNDADVISKAKNTLLETQKKISLAERELSLQKEKYQQTLTKLENDLEISKRELENKAEELKNAETQYEKSLSLGQENYSTSEVRFYTTLHTVFLDIKPWIVELHSFLLDIDSFIGITETQKQKISYDVSISALNIAHKSRTENLFLEVEYLLSVYENKYALLGEERKTKENLLQILTDFLPVLEKSSLLAESYYDVVHATISSPDLSESTLSSKKNTTSSFVKDMQSKKTSLQTKIQTVQNLSDENIRDLDFSITTSQAKTSLESAKIAFEKTQQERDRLIDSYAFSKEEARLLIVKAEQNLRSLQVSAEEQEQSLQKLIDGPTAEDIQKARNDVLQRELALQKVKSNISQYQIIAPFDGMIRKIDYKVGDTLLSDDDSFVYLENPDLIQVKILLDQIDIVKVEEQFDADIVFDAFPKKTFQGKVDEVNKTPVNSSGVVSYTVFISLHKGEEKIYSGMTATVNIVSEKAENVLYVPQEALIQKKDAVFVSRKKGDRTEEVSVKTGITNFSVTEIQEGVREGDVILLPQTTVIPNQKTGVGGFGGGAGGAPFIRTR
jgi:RND family efflux transporter MFP subunit